MTKRILPLLLATYYLLLPLAAKAAIIPCGPSTGRDCTFKDLGTLLVHGYNFLLGFGGLIALMFIVYGGLKMLQGWLSEEPETTFKEGVLTVRRAIGGLALLALAYLIVNTVLALFGAGDIDTLFNKAFGA